MKKHCLAMLAVAGGITIGGLGAPAYADTAAPDCSVTVTNGCWQHQWSALSPGAGWASTGETRSLPSTWDYQWAQASPGAGWVDTGETQVVIDRAHVPGTTDVTETQWLADGVSPADSGWSTTGATDTETTDEVAPGGYGYQHRNGNVAHKDTADWNAENQKGPDDGWVRAPALDVFVTITTHEWVRVTPGTPEVSELSHIEHRWALETQHTETRWERFVPAVIVVEEPPPGGEEPPPGGEEPPPGGEEPPPGGEEPPPGGEEPPPGGEEPPPGGEEPPPPGEEEPPPVDKPTRPSVIIALPGEPTVVPTTAQPAPPASGGVAITSGGVLPSTGGPDGMLAGLGLAALACGGLLVRRGLRPAR